MREPEPRPLEVRRVESVQLLDLGGGLSIDLELPGLGPDPDPSRVASELLRRLGIAAWPAAIAELEPAELAELLRWATAEVVYRAIRDGPIIRWASRLPPSSVGRLAAAREGQRS